MTNNILTAIFPGTFDPITNGHINLISRAAKLFPKLIVAVALSPNKKTLFNLTERVSFVSNALAHLSNVQVIDYDNLMADFAKEHNATILVRGVRTTGDFEYERQLAEMNLSLKPDLETVFMMPDMQMGFISSSIIKEVVRHGGDASRFVPQSVYIQLLKRFT